MEHHMHNMPSEGMKMYFHFGYEDNFFFKSLNIDNTLKMWSTCGVLFVLTIVFEAIKYARCVQCGCRASKGNCPTDGYPQDSSDNNVRLARNCYVGHLRSYRHRLIQTLLHTGQTAIGFALMLSIMSFNVCIIFAVLAGTAVGYYTFYRSYNEIEAIDSCH